eukprot:5305467-Pleurochrysis_carterae.AAC.1
MLAHATSTETAVQSQYTSQSKGSLIKARNKAEALTCVSCLFKAKLKAVPIHVMYHSIQQSNACEESPLNMRERCVSRIAEKKWVATTRKSRKSGRRKNLVEAPQKPESQKRAAKLESKSRWFETWMGAGERKRRSSTAPAACSRE